MGKLSFISDYIKYYFTSTNRHGIHSPFVYKLVEDVIYAKTPKEFFAPIEQRRKELKGSNKTIEFVDLGAHKGTYNKQVSTIAKRALKPAKYAKLLGRLVGHFKPQTSIELGTSLGISTLYQAKSTSGIFYTLEGSQAVLDIAQEGFNKLASEANIKAVQGDFKDALPPLLDSINKLDYVYFDGNHQYQPTIDYFEQCLTKVHNETVFIFDDINWSAEMKQAWQEIINHPKVTVSVNLFMVGLVFFRQEQEKEHFIIRF